MRCTNCGFESSEYFAFCPKCGAKSSEETPINYAADKVCSLFKDRLFLALCILFTCAGVLSWGNIGIPWIVILVSIFLWICYADAKNGIANVQHLRYLSGTVYANYVIFYIIGAICMVVGTIMLINMMFEKEISPYAALSIEVAITFLVIGVIVLLINVFALRKIHRFLKSLYLGVMHGNTDFYKVCKVRESLIFCAVVIGIPEVALMVSYFFATSFFDDMLTSAVTFLAIASPGCLAAVFILAAILINKYFIKETDI